MPTSEELLDELVRLRVIDIKRSIGSQNDTILEMNRAGFNPSRIANLLGTTPGTVSTAIQRAKKAPAGKKIGSKDGDDGK